MTLQERAQAIADAARQPAIDFARAHPEILVWLRSNGYPAVFGRMTLTHAYAPGYEYGQASVGVVASVGHK